jgi:two-component system, chemotaxis family, sensor kinase CheA
MSHEYLDRIRVAFQNEATEILSELDTALLELETNASDEGLIHRAFRAIHTLKGSGATAGYERLAEFAHTLEGVLDGARDRRLEVTPELVDAALRSCDVLRAILKGDESAAAAGTEVTAVLNRLLPGSAVDPDPRSVNEPRTAADSRTAYEVLFRPARELFHSGTDPVTLLDELRTLGPCHIVARTSEVPAFPSFDPESCYLRWDIRLVTDADEQAIRDVFMFVDLLCELEIRKLDDEAAALAVLSTLPAGAFDLFISETEDRLAEAESAALEMEAGPPGNEPVNAAFRAIHSIKGNVGLLLSQPGGDLPPSHCLPRLRDVAHGLESILVTARETGLSADIPELLLQTVDAMRQLLRAVEKQDGTVELSLSLMSRLGVVERPLARRPLETDDRETAFRNTAGQCLEMIESGRTQLASGAPGKAALKMCRRGLKTLMAAAEYDGRSELAASTAAQLIVLDRAIRNEENVEPDQLAGLYTELDNLRALISGACSQPKAAAPAVVRTAAAPPPVVSATIRVDQEKLDRLMRIVGELLVARGGFPILARKLRDIESASALAKELKDTGSQVSRIAEELQASVMSLRMMPVKTLFQRFPRMVRDLSRAMGKEVSFVTAGDDTELDKTILEQISDPMVHLVRNAVDHGIEPPAERARAGKPACGKIRLEACTEAGGVRIDIIDDGAGIDAGRLKQKAFSKGLITARQADSMSDADAFQLIFAPGLSTAEKVTDVSGRGVGMDVVRNNIAALRGSIGIESRRGEGTRLSIKLPTSVLISKGILLEAGGEEYILPLASIRDMVKVRADEVRTYRGRAMANVRGRVLGLVSLAESLGLPAKAADELSLAVIDDGQGACGLIADRFSSEVEVLVKPLSGGLAECREFLGAAIMGDGRVVLVINAGECAKMRAAGAAR